MVSLPFHSSLMAGYALFCVCFDYLFFVFLSPYSRYRWEITNKQVEKINKYTGKPKQNEKVGHDARKNIYKQEIATGLFSTFFRLRKQWSTF